MAEAGFEGEISREVSKKVLAREIIDKAKTQLGEDPPIWSKSSLDWQKLRGRSKEIVEFQTITDRQTENPILRFKQGDGSFWDWEPKQLMAGILSGGIHKRSADTVTGDVFIGNESGLPKTYERVYIEAGQAAMLFHRGGKALGFDDADLSGIIYQFSREATVRPQKQYLFKEMMPSFYEGIAVDFSIEPAESSTRTKSVEELQREVALYQSELRSAKERAERKDREIETQKAETVSAVQEIAKLNREIADLKSRTPGSEQGGQTEYERCLSKLGLSASELRSLNKEQVSALLTGVIRGVRLGVSPDKFAGDDRLKAVGNKVVQDTVRDLTIIGAQYGVKIK